MFDALLRGWATALSSLLCGLAFWFEKSADQRAIYFFAPVGIAAVFAVQTLVRMSDAVTHHPLMLPARILFEKFVIAGVFFAVGVTLAWAGLF